VPPASIVAPVSVAESVTDPPTVIVVEDSNVAIVGEAGADSATGGNATRTNNELPRRRPTTRRADPTFERFSMVGGNTIGSTQTYLLLDIATIPTCALRIEGG
jgi:hypothetical protein